MRTVLDPEIRTQFGEQIDQAEAIVGLGHDEHPDSAESNAERVERRRVWRGEVQDSILDLSKMLPLGFQDQELRCLLTYLAELDRAIDLDPAAKDEVGEVLITTLKMRDVLRRMVRRSERETFETPDEAFVYLKASLAGLQKAELAKLLDVTPKTLSNWSGGGLVKQNAERVDLMAHLAYYLRPTLTPTGFQMWLQNPSSALDGQTPSSMIDSDLGSAYGRLIDLARSAGGQLAA